MKVLMAIFGLAQKGGCLDLTATRTNGVTHYSHNPDEPESLSEELDFHNGRR